jgi:hypothetical protein
MPVRTGGLQIIWKYLWETQPLGDREWKSLMLENDTKNLYVAYVLKKWDFLI